MFDYLVRRFQEAGLKLEIASGPIVGSVSAGGREIVQIDIRRKLAKNARSEYFRIWPGADTNKIQVVNIDKDLSQLVLMVHEGARTFEENVGWRAVRDAKLANQNDWVGELVRAHGLRRADIRVRKGDIVSVVRKTSPQKRHFLCGVDERQLFICQLPRAVSTVRGAHAVLKTTDVLFAEGRAAKVVRQGEWFFLEPSKEERKLIEDGIQKKLLTVEKTVPIGPFAANSVRGRKVRQFSGNAHTADELLVMSPKLLEHGFPIRSREIFVRGRIRHVDHATVKFDHWKKVIRNTEPQPLGVAASGIGWVD